MRARAVAVSCLTVLVLFLAACEDTTKLREMDTMMKGENWEAAIERGKLYLQENPETTRAEEVKTKLAESYFGLAKVYDKKRQHDQGIQILDTIINEYKQSPFYADAMRELPRFKVEYGRKLASNGDYIKASQQFREVAEQFRNSAQAADAQRDLQTVGVITFNAGKDLWIMNADGTNARRLVANAIDGAMDFMGSTVAFIRPEKAGASEGKLLKFDRASGKETELLQSPIAQRPSISPEGQDIAVTKGDLFQVVPTGDGDKETYRGITTFDTFGGWAPDYSKLLGYHRKLAANANILLIDRAFKSYDVLATIPVKIRDAALSPDGRNVIFATQAGLFVMVAGAGDQVPLISTADTGIDVAAIAFAPDSKHILFVGKGKDDANDRFYTVDIQKNIAPLDVQTDPPLVPDRNRGLSWSRGYDIG